MSTWRSSRRSAANSSAESMAVDLQRDDPLPAGTTEPLRITPRNSDINGSTTDNPKETPYGTLRYLASIIPKPTTPLRRASSTGPPSTHRSVKRTPGAQVSTPGDVTRLNSAKRPNAATPHARAAMREIELRRAAALTPGKDRRRSGRQQRETPRDVLRQLSKVLAPSTKSIEPSPLTTQLENGRLPMIHQEDDLDDGPEPVRPRLSLPLGDIEEDDSFLMPPQSTGLLEDDNITQQSVELPRRAASEQPPRRLSRGSFGSIRVSDRFDDMIELGMDAVESEGIDQSFVQANLEEYSEQFLEDDPSILRSEPAVNFLQGVDGFGPERTSLASRRESDVTRQIVPEDDSETTFIFTVPQRNAQAERRLFQEPQTQSEEEVEDENEEEEAEESEIDQVDTVGDMNMNEAIVSEPQKLAKERPNVPRVKKSIRVSRHGIPYSSLPTGVVKKLATTFLRASGNSNAKISKDTLHAIMQASDWFFEQVSEDLGAYANHANRKTIDDNDVITLMKRQRQTNATTTPFALAQKYLPRELLQDLRMAPQSKSRHGRPVASNEDREDEDE